MILSWSKPSPAELQRFVDAQAGEELTYPEVGASAGKAPGGYKHDSVRIALGSGEQTLRTAENCVFAWKHFQTGWSEIFPSEVEVKPGTTLAVVARVYGLWSVHSCRIIEVIHEENRRGFIYGTLPGHGESGEERFLVERLPDGSVWYQINAFFRPRDWRVRVMWPLISPQMNRFRRDSANVMQREVQAACSTSVS